MAKRKLNINQALIIIATILGLAIASYGYFSYRAKIDVAKMKEEATKREVEQKQQAVKDNEEKREKCFSEVEAEKVAWWNRNCKGRGLEEKCSLNREMATTIFEWRDKENANCIKMYPGD